MSHAATSAAEIPGEGFFDRAARKARALGNKLWRGTSATLTWLGRMIKKGAKTSGRGAGYVVGAVGWVVTGVLKVALWAISLVAAVAVFIVGVVLLVAFGLLVAIAWLLTVIVNGLRFVINFGWDGSNWLVMGRPTTWKLFRTSREGVRKLNGEHPINSVLEKIGLVESDEEWVKATDEVVVSAEEAVRLRVFDEDKSLVEERFFPNAARAHEFADERYNMAPVTSEVTPVSQVIDEYASEEYNAMTAEQKATKADEIAKAMLGVELLGTEGENIERLRAIIDEEVEVPTPVDVAATVYSNHEMPEGLAAKLDQAAIEAMTDPRAVDWVEFMLAPEVPAAYRYFANKAKVAGNKKDLSYWNARAWTRENPQGMNAWREPAKMFALYLSKVDRATVNQTQARQGVYDECHTLTEISDVLNRHLDEEDIAEAERRSVSSEQ